MTYTARLLAYARLLALCPLMQARLLHMPFSEGSRLSSWPAGHPETIHPAGAQCRKLCTTPLLPACT